MMQNNSEDSKIQLIRKISSYHPGFEAGTRRGFSWYIGGMADDGAWDFWKMYDHASMAELEACLKELIESSKPAPPLTAEQKRKSEIMVVLPNGTITNEFQKELWEAFQKETENRMLWGKQA